MILGGSAVVVISVVWLLSHGGFLLFLIGAGVAIVGTTRLAQVRKIERIAGKLDDPPDG